MVPMYEKFCDKCLANHPTLRQEKFYWKASHDYASEKEKLIQFLHLKGRSMEQVALRVDRHNEIVQDKMCYWKNVEADSWYLYIPRCGVGSLKAHTVIENQDGTITVTPSIEVVGHDNGKPVKRHGYLTNGKWKEV